MLGHSWTHGVALGDDAVQTKGLDLMTWMGPFQLSIFCDSLRPNPVRGKILLYDTVSGACFNLDYPWDYVAEK